MSPRTLDALVIGAGQAGLAAAYHLQRRGLEFLVVEASGEASGSWRRYYDSLTLFSPARYSSLPGRAFPGDPGRYPTRDEVADYLSAYAQHFRFPIRFHSRVVGLERTAGGFVVTLGDGQTLGARAVVVATGSFAHPNLPVVEGQELFQGRRLHSLHYREPSSYVGQRVVVVGGGNTAVQVAAELAQVARVTLATRSPLRFLPQRLLGKDLHWWLHHTGLDRTRFAGDQGTPVLDDGTYRAALSAGRPEHRPMFSRFTRHGVVWSDGTEEAVDSVVFATGYRSTAEFLGPLGALDERGLVAQRGGVSTRVPALFFVGFSLQRSFRSATLRGVGPDAEVVVRQLAAARRGSRHPARRPSPALAGHQVR